MPIMSENHKIKLSSINDIRKIYCENNKIYSSGDIVSYIVDGKTYREEYDEGENVLNPKTFNVPVKSGYVFAGWSETQTGAVLSNKVMGDGPITLYARYVAQRIRNFAYTGGMQSFTAPYKGLYLFTLIGPGGGGGCQRDYRNFGKGGNGGKTTMYVALNANDTIYVGVGGGGVASPQVSAPAPGGWNGGGAGSFSNNYRPGAGGGATHIGRINATLAGTTGSNLLAVAGGGGGAGAGSSDSGAMPGGNGGGLSGGNGAGVKGNYGAGGTQTTGYAHGVGQGGASYYAGGAGAGYYGGYGGGQSKAGGGGSGYIATSTTAYAGKAYTNSTVAGAGAAGGTVTALSQTNVSGAHGAVYVDLIAC